MKTKLFLTMLLAIASVGAKANEVQCILPWGADEPWQMKYVLDTNQPNDDWTTANYDDSEWETLTGPLSSLSGSAVDGVAQYTWDERDIRFNLRRTFTLNEVNPEGYTFAAIHDNDIKVYINGQLVWEDTYHGGGICTSHLVASFFQEGENQLAIFFWGQTDQDYLDYALFSGDYYDAVYYNGIVVDGIRYIINDDGKTVTARERVGGYDPSYLRFPETITFRDKDYPVTGIYDWGFPSENLTSVFIPKTMTGDVWFYGANNIDYIEVDPENPVYDSRDNCNCIVRTATNEVVRGSNKGVIPTSCTGVSLGAFEYCKHIFIPKHITHVTNDYGYYGNGNSSAETIVVEEGNYIYDSRENCNCIIETSTNRLIAAGSQFIIPNSVASFGPNSLQYRTGVIDIYQEYPTKIFEDVGGGEITLQVPEGLIPRYLYQG